MKHMKMTLLATVASALFLVSCNTARYAYSPNAHNVPVLTKQFDSKLSANYSTNLDINTESTNGTKYSRNRSNGYDLQGAIAVTDHIGIQGSYFSRKETTHGDVLNGDSGTVRYKRSMPEFGAGYFAPINKKKSIFFQVFAGVGFGKLNITETARDYNGFSFSRYYASDLFKYYLEPAIIFKSSNETIAGSVSTRLSVLSFKNVKTNYTMDEKTEYRLDSLNRYSTFFLEPAIVNSFGFNKLPGFRIEYQFGVSIPLALSSEPILYHRPFNFSLGLVFDIGKLIRGSADRSKD